MTRLGALGQLERGQRIEDNEDMEYCVIRNLPKPGWESFYRTLWGSEVKSQGGSRGGVGADSDHGERDGAGAKPARQK